MTEAITGNERLVQELQRVVLAIEASGHALLPSASDELLQMIAETAARIFGATAASIALVNEKRQLLNFEVAVGPGHEEIVGAELPIDQGIVGYVASTGQPLILSSVETDPRFAHDIAQRTGYVPRSILAIPLCFDDRILGVMEVLDKGGSAPFGMRDLEVMGLFARQAAIAIHLSQQFDLLGEVLLRRIGEVVNPNDEPELVEVEEALLSPPDENLANDLVEVADLFNSISELGSSERHACIEILGTFAEYVHSRPRLVG